MGRQSQRTVRPTSAITPPTAFGLSSAFGPTPNILTPKPAVKTDSTLPNAPSGSTVATNAPASKVSDTLSFMRPLFALGQRVGRFRRMLE